MVVMENHHEEMMNDKCVEGRSEKNQESWNEQKNRMESMLAKLKNEIQDIKTMDKDLTRQFITLGGLISKIKNEQLFEEDDYEDDDLALINENSGVEEEENKNKESSMENVEDDDTKL